MKVYGIAVARYKSEYDDERWYSEYTGHELDPGMFFLQREAAERKLAELLAPTPVEVKPASTEEVVQKVAQATPRPNPRWGDVSYPTAEAWFEANGDPEEDLENNPFGDDQDIDWDQESKSWYPQDEDDDNHSHAPYIVEVEVWE